MFFRRRSILRTLEIVGLAHVLVEVLGRLHIDVRGRHERVDADPRRSAALDLGLDAAGGDGAFGKLGEDVVPVLLLLGLVERQDGGTRLVFEAFRRAPRL